MSFQITYSLFSVLLTILQYNVYRAEEVIMSLCYTTPVFSAKASAAYFSFFFLCFLKCKIIDNYEKCFWAFIFQRADQVARLLLNVFGNCFVFTVVLGELHAFCWSHCWFAGFSSHGSICMIEQRDIMLPPCDQSKPRKNVWSASKYFASK